MSSHIPLSVPMTEGRHIFRPLASASVAEVSKKLRDSRRMSTPGERIKELRLARRLTQARLADLLSAGGPQITRGAVGNWERDQGIKFENMARLAAFFSVDVNWIATGEGVTPSMQEDIAEVQQAGGVSQVFRLLELLEDPKVAEAIKIAKYLTADQVAALDKLVRREERRQDTRR